MHIKYSDYILYIYIYFVTIIGVLASLERFILNIIFFVYLSILAFSYSIFLCLHLILNAT